MQPSADFVVPETLGFESVSEGWWKTLGERRLLFTRLRSRLDLEKTERLQRTVFGVSDRDLASSSILVAVPGDFDGLLASDPARARDWCFRLRDNLEAAFASGYVITGFAGRRGEPHGYYLLERDLVFE